MEKKEWIEELVVRTTVREVLTDERIEAIAAKASELLEKEASENAILPSLEQSLKDVKKRIKNILDLMEQGIATESTRDRLLELEANKADLEKRVARESIKKPSLSKERIAFWLHSFRNGDINNIEYRRRVIDTLVNSIYVYDTDNGKGREILFTFNISGNNTMKIKCSDIACFAPPNHANPNYFFVVKHVFGFVIKIEDVD